MSATPTSKWPASYPVMQILLLLCSTGWLWPMLDNMLQVNVVSAGTARVQIWSNCISGFALGASQQVHHRQRCTRPLVPPSSSTGAEWRPGGVLVYAGVWQSTPVSSRRRVRPVRLGPHRGEGPPSNPETPQKVHYEGLPQVLPVQSLREQVHPN